uniref:Fukutin n=1 Tax=Acrobeloides nanus TaxID=290746 RepID=A0A914CQP0_9BILA
MRKLKKILMGALVLIALVWLYFHMSTRGASTFILIDQAILNQLNQTNSTATVPQKILFASTDWPIWNISYDQIDPITIVDNPEKDYLLFVFPNETRAIKRFPTNSSVIQLKNGATVELLIPSNVNEFMWRWNRGRFLECHKEVVNGRKSTYQRISLSFIKRMSEFQDFLVKHNATAFLLFGTLLGWRRECSIIPHTSDIDFGMFPSEHSDALIEDLSSTYSVIWYLGKPEMSFEMSFYVDGVNVDLFYLYERENGTYTGGYRVPQRQRIQFNYPKIQGVCAVDLLDHLMFVPCNVDEFVEADYGKNWSYDKNKFVWDKDPLNIEEHEFYSEEEWQKVFKK